MSPSSAVKRGTGTEDSALDFRPVAYAFRYCETCRREWPARQQSCPLCLRWLGDRPQRRTEWQIVPEQAQAIVHSRVPPGPDERTLVGASALMLRVLSPRPPEAAVDRATFVLRTVLHFRASNGETTGTLFPIAGHGWFLATARGLRPAFLDALALEQRLRAALPQLTAALGGRIRFGIWLDQYLVALDGAEGLKLSLTASEALFDFEPDDLLLSSEEAYQANRHFEKFVCIPRRLLNGEEAHGYRLLGRKRPSAQDHARSVDAAPFVGRGLDLAFLESCLETSHGTALRVALVAEAGSGKTRLIREWRRRHPDLRVLAANFSLFGGGLAEFAAELVELPDGPRDPASLCAAILERIAVDRTQVLVLDDLHWADPESTTFVSVLLESAAARGRLVLLVARPSGRAVLQSLAPAIERLLAPLPAPSLEDLARQLISSPAVAEIAVARSGGNPLFVEQFAAWAAECGYPGIGESPRNLHQVITARIGLLSKVRLVSVRRALPWGGAVQREAIERELDSLEDEIGRWLDRLETADYGDRCEVARHLIELERVDFDLFLARTLAGRPRPRSGRLAEAIERLLIGSADSILADLTARVGQASSSERMEIHREAERAGNVLMQHFHWSLARDFLALARDTAEPWQRPETAERLRRCENRLSGAVIDEATILAAKDPDESPAVDALQLPAVWARLGLLYGSAPCFRRAAEAAEAIEDRALAAWARKKASQPAQS
jgi:hypothetical protein